MGGYDESDIKGYDNFDQLKGALDAAGVDLSGGDYTLLAPSNSAIDKHNKEVGTPIDADVLKCHVIEGKVSMDGLTTDQKTLNGGTLTSYRVPQELARRRDHRPQVGGPVQVLQLAVGRRVRQRHHPGHRHGPRAGRLRGPAVSGCSGVCGSVARDPSRCF